jgi:hypothetical protein
VVAARESNPQPKLRIATPKAARNETLVERPGFLNTSYLKYTFGRTYSATSTAHLLAQYAYPVNENPLLKIFLCRAANMTA